MATLKSFRNFRALVENNVDAQMLRKYNNLNVFKQLFNIILESFLKAFGLALLFKNFHQKLCVFGIIWLSMNV